jgi:hypothetical protein
VGLVKRPVQMLEKTFESKGLVDGRRHYSGLLLERNPIYDALLYDALRKEHAARGHIAGQPALC